MLGPNPQHSSKMNKSAGKEKRMILIKEKNTICPLVEAACCITANGKGYDIDNNIIWVPWVKDYIKRRIAENEQIPTTKG